MAVVGADADRPVEPRDERGREGELPRYAVGETEMYSGSGVIRSDGTPKSRETPRGEIHDAAPSATRNAARPVIAVRTRPLVMSSLTAR